ncbi:Uma2 family endonuclease [Nocardioides nitrophenolicus]|uniref:Uma2 family endonuclease n=1 Tax=Nocardioides nitrophenolicus TaxID=60489 RepID=UPI00195DDC86|nr:Uma2 family endonuclease [Nocardioides nitrophenolicus]MBM7518394.1 Uma2 family endonuclease [Nocardioides nitrophenolicus]
MTLDLDLPQGQTLTAYDVAQLWEPDRRLELIDGVLTVMSSPSIPHQRTQMRLLKLLFAAAPPHLETWAAPVDVLSPDTVVQPDVLVVDPSHVVGSDPIEVNPLLVIEILSPSTALYDLNTKFKRYERAGIPSYWVVDPLGGRLIVWELREGAYVEVLDRAGDEPWTARQPFAVTVVPSELVGPEGGR